MTTSDETFLLNLLDCFCFVRSIVVLMVCVVCRETGGAGRSGGHLRAGHYYKDFLEEDPGMLREGPAFTMGGRLRHGGGRTV